MRASPVAYDAFAPGPHPVVTSDGTLVDHDRADRVLPFRLWQPRDARRAPLIVYSHSSYGHRGQASLLCGYLASHGYAVAAAEHTGNTRAEWAARAGAPPLSEDERAALLARIIGDRVPDLLFLASSVISMHSGAIDARRLGLVGWSFGGWAVLATLERDARFASVVAHAPAGGRDPLPGIIPATLTLRWKREVPALFLAAERDRFVPLDRVRDVFDRAPEPKRMFVLAEADHGHFADEIQPEGPPSAEVAHVFTHSLTRAHLDATLGGDETAARFLADDVIGALRQRHINAFTYP